MKQDSGGNVAVVRSIAHPVASKVESMADEPSQEQDIAVSEYLKSSGNKAMEYVFLLLFLFFLSDGFLQ